MFNIGLSEPSNETGMEQMAILFVLANRAWGKEERRKKEEENGRRDIYLLLESWIEKDSLSNQIFNTKRTGTGLKMATNSMNGRFEGGHSIYAENFEQRR